jgi:hypothetical protein
VLPGISGGATASQKPGERTSPFSLPSFPCPLFPSHFSLPFSVTKVGAGLRPARVDNENTEAYNLERSGRTCGFECHNPNRLSTNSQELSR